MTTTNQPHKDKIETIKQKIPVTTQQLREIYNKTQADIIIAEYGFEPEAIDYAEDHLPTVQLRIGFNHKVVKRRRKI